MVKDKETSGLFGRLLGRGGKATPPHPEREEEQDHGVPLQPDAPVEPAQGEEAEQSPETDAAKVIPFPRPGPRPVPAPVPSESKPTPQPTPIKPPPKPKGWFGRLKQGLARTSNALSENIHSLFAKRSLDETTLEELEDALIEADLGVDMAARITEAIASGRYEKDISAEKVREVLAEEVAKVLEPVAKPFVIDDTRRPHVVLVVGVNGTGKTTTIGKLAHRFAAEGRKVVLCAGDTFRAAAIDQIKIWGERAGATVVAGALGADAAGVAYDALDQARKANADLLLIDTAGRLQNKADLMAELGKIVRVLRKLDDSAPHSVLLVLDATTGQNAVAQAEAFSAVAGVTGIIMTKLDGTARGGILVAIAEKFGLPVHAIGVGEGIDDLQPFEAREFAAAIAGRSA